MTNYSRQPSGIPSGGAFAAHQHAEADIPGLGEAMQPSRTIFSDEDLARTHNGKTLTFHRNRLHELSRRPIINMGKIRRLEKALDRFLNDQYQKELVIPASENEQWHRLHPSAPAWAHPESSKINTLYKELRGFEVEAESWRGLGRAHPSELSYTPLGDRDKAVLSDYFSHHEMHGCKDHALDGPYWQAQRRLQAIVAKMPILDQPVTVWRGEKYSTAEQSDPATKRNVRKRILEVMTLEPKMIITLEGCTATSLSLHTAASLFSGSGRPENFKVPDAGGTENAVHSVLFEMETDRGLLIDTSLPGTSGRNEDEILLPMGIKYEVVGHSQLGSVHVTGNPSNTVYHLVKLKLAS